MSNFDILNHQVKGLTRMNSVPYCYQQKHILLFIKRQLDDDIASFEKMDEIDRDTLATYMMNALGADEVCAIVDNEELPGMMDNIKYYMNSYSTMSAYDLAEFMRKAITKHFETPINDLFNEAIAERDRNDLTSEGVTAQQDEITGEVIWL